jgi:hypothetical protein
LLMNNCQVEATTKVIALTYFTVVPVVSTRNRIRSLTAVFVHTLNQSAYCRIVKF